MENNALKLEEILLAAAEWMNDPESKETTDALEALKSKMIVREYLPIKQKELIASKIVSGIDLDDENRYKDEMFIEMGKTFYGLLAYVNVDPNYDEELFDYKYFDVFWASGFGDFILSFCKKDYDRLCDMIDTKFSFENLSNLISTIMSMNTDKLDEFIKEAGEVKKTVNEDVIHDLATIVAQNDATLEGLKETIDGIATAAVKEKVK